MLGAQRQQASHSAVRSSARTCRSMAGSDAFSVRQYRSAPQNRYANGTPDEGGGHAGGLEGGIGRSRVDICPQTRGSGASASALMAGVQRSELFRVFWRWL